MRQYSIKDLELLTGIKSHTLRMWESRYGIIKPKRTETNIRYYLDEDLRDVMNVAHLNKLGYKISKIAEMCAEKRNAMVLENTEECNCEHTESSIQCLITAMMNFDEQTFNQLLSNAILRLGFEKCMLQLVYPFLEKIGMLWQASSICVAQEHFVSNLLRQKVLAATDAQIINNPETATKALLFCPSGELHELNLLFANYVLRSRGMHTLYLGADLPLCDLENIKQAYNPDFFVMAFTAGYSQKNQEQLKERLSNQLNHIPGFIIGAQCSDLKGWPENISPASSFEEIELQIKAKI